MAAPSGDSPTSALEKELNEIAENTAKLEARAAQLRATIQKDYQQVDDLVKVRSCFEYLLVSRKKKSAACGCIENFLFPVTFEHHNR